MTKQNKRSKAGRPKGSKATAPRAGSTTELVCKAFDEKPRRAGEIAAELECSEQLAAGALDQWRSDWRETVKKAEEAEDELA